MIEPRLFINLSITFFFMVIAGTLIHETGHYTMARALGYQASINYISMKSESKMEFKRLFDTIHTIKSPSLREKKKIKMALKKYNNESLLITSAGPITNMMLGTIGFVLLLIMAGNKSFRRYRWILIFVSLLWSRQVLNCMIMLVEMIFNTRLSKMRGDEFKLSLWSGLPYYSFNILTCVIAMPIIAITIFKFIKREEWLTFFAAGILGGGLGVWVWFFWIGPIMLP